MAKIKDIWLDMDNTLFDFSKGNLDRALHSMADPSYYKTLEPFESAMDALGEMTDDYDIFICSGIPDMVRHGKYLDFPTVEQYMEYYQEVMRNKLETLDKYFGRGFFTVVEFTKASESKASIVKTRWYENSNKLFQHACLVDDQEPYVRTWRKMGGHGMVANSHKPLSVILNDISEGNYS